MPDTPPLKTFDDYQTYMNELADMHAAISLMHWDQEVYMPPSGADLRAQQIASLSALAHEKQTNERFGGLLQELDAKNGLDAYQSRNITESLKDFKKATKYPTSFVIDMAKASSKALASWKVAREKDDFGLFEDKLQTIIGLKRNECELLGYDGHPYNALLDEFEPYTSTTDLEDVFTQVKDQLVPYVQELLSKKPVDDSFLYKQYDKSAQWDFGIELLKQMGYDFDAGRQDISTHPFTINFSSQDVRVTTRINETDLNEMIWSCIHEGGHALYEQGLKNENYGLPLGEPISLGIHESQSRLWENQVGRSLPYWKANYKRLQKIFPENLKDISVEDFYHAINAVKPSFIRTSADELTYHLHILIRFEIEKEIITGNLNAKDLPDAWNKRYKDYLGIDVPSNAQGVLQDIHWSHGSIGYFPTYSLGSFYAAQFYSAMIKDVPSIPSEIEKGDTHSVLDWLREKVHQHGKFYTAEEVCTKATGEKLDFKYFMEYAKGKFGGIYS